MELLILSLLFVISVLHGTSGCRLITPGNGMSCDEKKEILDYHNERRSHVARGLQKEKNPQSPAENMLVMHWNSGLASDAQKYAEKCIWGHSPESERPNQGESLAYSTNSSEFRFKPVSGAVIWFDEVVKFGYTAGEYSQETGHYSQLIWADSEELGCGFSYYIDEDNAYRSYTVCRYRPPGNWIGQSPYPAGEPNCSKYGLRESINYKGLCTKATPEEQKAWDPCSGGGSDGGGGKGSSLSYIHKKLDWTKQSPAIWTLFSYIVLCIFVMFK